MISFSLVRFFFADLFISLSSSRRRSSSDFGRRVSADIVVEEYFGITNGRIFATASMRSFGSSIACRSIASVFKFFSSSAR